MFAKATITQKLSAFDLVRENTRDDILDFIIELDGAVAETDFTERLVTRLATSLKPDMTAKQFDKMIDEIKYS